MIPKKIGVSQKALDALVELAGGEDHEDRIPDLVRQAIAAFLLNPNQVQVADAIGDTRLPFLTTAPAGNWDAAIREAGTITLSRQIADELYVRTGDVVIRATGDSMVGAGIMDRALLVVRPVVNNRPPKRGTITLVQITVQNGPNDVSYESTIKHWMSETDLRDGNNNPFPMPAKTQTITPVAEAVGVICAL